MTECREEFFLKLIDCSPLLQRIEPLVECRCVVRDFIVAERPSTLFAVVDKIIDPTHRTITDPERDIAVLFPDAGADIENGIGEDLLEIEIAGEIKMWSVG